MAPSFGFIPSGERARGLDRAMRAGLGDSLDYICNEIGGAVPYDRDGVSRLIQGLREGAPYSPGIFAHYYRLVPALQSGDFPLAEQLFAKLAVAMPGGGALDVLGLDDEALAPRRADYETLMRSAADPNFRVLPPPANVTERFKVRFAEGMGLIEKIVPELAHEVRAIVREAIGVVGDEAMGYHFDGGSCYALWGALFLNAKNHDTPFAMAEAIVHESAHSLLFGFCTEEALIENADEERYPSPLRYDPRPMDGIYHATFVCARMHWFCEQVIAAGLEGVDLQGRLDLHRRNFADGYGVVASHGRLTGTGRALMAGASNYMSAAV